MNNRRQDREKNSLPSFDSCSFLWTAHRFLSIEQNREKSACHRQKLRDYLRNIFEYAYYKKWCTEKEIILVRPPYKSIKHKVNSKFALQYKERFSNLFWNCQESDFAIYTIPSEVEDYGVTKKDVGLMIFEDIVKSGYEPYIDYDKILIIHMVH